MDVTALKALTALGTDPRVQGPPAPAGQASEDAAAERKHAGLVKAAREFEAVFLNQLMRAMRKTVPDNQLFNSNGPTKFYQQMQDAEMAKAMASDNGGLGIADLIVRQLSPRSGGTADAAAGSRTMGPVPARAAASYRSQSRLDAVRGRLKVLQAKAGVEHPAAADTLRRFESEFHAAAEETGLEPEVLLAVVMAESGGDPDAVSDRGARGLMQLMPGTARELGVEDLHHPGENLRGGARYLADLLDRYDGELPLALAAYNAGPGRVDRAGRRIPAIAETRNYVEKVTRMVRDLECGTDLDMGTGRTQAQGSSTE